MLRKVKDETVSLKYADCLPMSRWVALGIAETEATKAVLVCWMSRSAVWMAASASTWRRRASGRFAGPSPNCAISSCMPPILDCSLAAIVPARPPSV